MPHPFGSCNVLQNVLCPVVHPFVSHVEAEAEELSGFLLKCSKKRAAEVEAPVQVVVKEGSQFLHLPKTLLQDAMDEEEESRYQSCCLS